MKKGDLVRPRQRYTETEQRHGMLWVVRDVRPYYPDGGDVVDYTVQTTALADGFTCWWGKGALEHDGG